MVSPNYSTEEMIFLGAMEETSSYPYQMYSLRAHETTTDDDSDSNNIHFIMILDLCQLAMVIVGVIANSITVTTLFVNGQFFSPAILSLLRHQSWVDAWICCIGAIMIVQPPMWMTSYYYLDIFICHLWHSQEAYWIPVYVSIWNLVAISSERYLAVCHPFKHKNYTKRSVHATLAAIYAKSMVILGPGMVQVSLKDGACISEYSIPGQVGQIFFFYYSIYSWLTFYIIPCILLCVLYGLVIFTFRKRLTESQFSSTRVIDKATAELTKTAVVVTAIFIICLGYDCWYYMLGYTGVVVYKKSTLVQKFGLLMASFNSVCNPFVYALLMPAYRKSVHKTMCGNNVGAALSNTNKQTSSSVTNSSAA